jgi:hypothetical protein
MAGVRPSLQAVYNFDDNLALKGAYLLSNLAKRTVLGLDDLVKSSPVIKDRCRKNVVFLLLLHEEMLITAKAMDSIHSNLVFYLKKENLGNYLIDEKMVHGFENVDERLRELMEEAARIVDDKSEYSFLPIPSEAGLFQTSGKLNEHQKDVMKGIIEDLKRFVAAEQYEIAENFLQEKKDFYNAAKDADPSVEYRKSYERAIALITIFQTMFDETSASGARLLEAFKNLARNAPGAKRAFADLLKEQTRRQKTTELERYTRAHRDQKTGPASAGRKGWFGLNAPLLYSLYAVLGALAAQQTGLLPSLTGEQSNNQRALNDIQQENTQTNRWTAEDAANGNRTWEGGRTSGLDVNFTQTDPPNGDNTTYFNQTQRGNSVPNVNFTQTDPPDGDNTTYFNLTQRGNRGGSNTNSSSGGNVDQQQQGGVTGQIFNWFRSSGRVPTVFVPQPGGFTINGITYSGNSRPLDLVNAAAEVDQLYADAQIPDYPSNFGGQVDPRFGNSMLNTNLVMDTVTSSLANEARRTILPVFNDPFRLNKPIKLTRFNTKNKMKALIIKEGQPLTTESYAKWLRWIPAQKDLIEMYSNTDTVTKARQFVTLLELAPTPEEKDHVIKYFAYTASRTVEIFNSWRDYAIFDLADYIGSLVPQPHSNATALRAACVNAATAILESSTPLQTFRTIVARINVARGDGTTTSIVETINNAVRPTASA